jgi:hypothetical protein
LDAEEDFDYKKTSIWHQMDVFYFSDGSEKNDTVKLKIFEIPLNWLVPTKTE